MKTITAYMCEFCGKVYKTRSGAWKHEKRCFSNPSRRACQTCRHCEQRSLGIFVADNVGTMHEAGWTYRHCALLDIELDGPQVKGHQWRYDCEHHEEIGRRNR